MGKVFCAGTPSHLAAAAVEMVAGFNLFDRTRGVETLTDKPRSANASELHDYLMWCAARAGVAVTSAMSFTVGGIFCPAANRIIVPLPGYGDDPAVIMEETDATGAVVRTSRIGVDRKGALGLKADAVRAVCALPKVRKARTVKVKPVETVAAPAIIEEAPVAAAASDSALVARVEALEALVARMARPAVAGRPVRTEAERRAILRAWRMRREMRERADLDRRALLAANAANAALREERGNMAMALAEEAAAVDQLRRRRGRSAARMVAARASRRTAQREARGYAAGLAQAQRQVARLQPLADAVVALMAPAAATAPLADNVVSLAAAR